MYFGDHGEAYLPIIVQKLRFQTGLLPAKGKEEKIVVTINGEEKQAVGKTLYAYLTEEGYDTSRVVVEQNLAIIPQDQLESTQIREGDQIEILCFVGGG